MADLHFVEFALIPSPVRKEKQFRLSGDFSAFDLFSHGRAILLSVFPSSFEFSHHGQRPLFGDPQNVLHDEDEVEAGKIFQQQVEIVAY